MSAAVFPFPGKINEMRLEMVFGNEIFFVKSPKKLTTTILKSNLLLAEILGD